MGADDRFWDRDDLYEEVWTTPMQTLAKKYGLSDVGLAKICRKLAIPVPGRGSWARKEAGQSFDRVPLPPLKEMVLLAKPARRLEPPELTGLATKDEIAIVEQLEKVPSEVLMKRGRLSHRLIVQAREALKHAQVSEGRILRTRETCLDIRVSKGSLDRALRIMAGLISAIEDRGFTVAVEARRQEQKEETTAKIYGQTISFGLTERTERIAISSPPKGGVLERVLTFGGKPVTVEPSGRLSIEVSGWGSSQRNWRDGKTQRLEDQLPQIVTGFIRLAFAARAADGRRAAEEQERQRIAEELASLDKSIKAEQSRVNALRNDAARWLRAERMRSFISAARDAAIQHGQSVERGSAFGNWVVWAEVQADRLDPLKESPPSILDRKTDVASAHTSLYGYGYHQPDPPFRFPKPIWRMK